MGREIKFRGKRLDNGEWVYGSLILTDSEYEFGCRIQPFGAHLYAPPVDPETVGQYIGLKDRNGVEIYEGDLTKDEFDRVALIYWKDDEARFAMRYVGQKTEYRMFINHLKTLVIGNRWEHPHLLKEADDSHE